MSTDGAAWCGLGDPPDDIQECADCGRDYDPYTMVQLDEPDDVWLCPKCWQMELADHPYLYEVDDDGEAART